MDSTPSVPAKVLIVDDLKEARWILSNLIRGVRAVTAASGKEALARIRQEAPDVVLLDVGLPDMDGFEVLTHRGWMRYWRLLPEPGVPSIGRCKEIA